MFGKKYSFSLNNNYHLKKEEKITFINAYYKLYKDVYKKDVYDAYLELVSGEDILKPSNNVLKLSSNMKRINKVIDSLNKRNSLLLKIYVKDKLIGYGRVTLNKKVIFLKEIAFIDEQKKDVIKIYSLVIEYLKNYFYEKNYLALKVEVPFKEVKLLTKMYQLGFIEETDDIKINKDCYTYILTKELERKKDE